VKVFNSSTQKQRQRITPGKSEPDATVALK